MTDNIHPQPRRTLTGGDDLDRITETGWYWFGIRGSALPSGVPAGIKRAILCVLGPAEHRLQLLFPYRPDPDLLYLRAAGDGGSRVWIRVDRSVLLDAMELLTREEMTT